MRTGGYFEREQERRGRDAAEGPPASAEQTRAAVLARLQHGAGNASVCRMLEERAALDESAVQEIRRETGEAPEVEPHAGGDDSDARTAVEQARQQRDGDDAVAPVAEAAAADEGGDERSAAPLTIGGSVGRGGRNAAADVKTVADRLQALGLPAAEGDVEALGGAIERFQRERLGWRRPDGRVDPRGRTLRALDEQPAAAPAHSRNAQPAKDHSAADTPVPAGGDPTVAEWLAEQPTDNRAMASWLLAAATHGFLGLPKRSGQNDPKWQLERFAEGGTVVEADASGSTPIEGLRLVMSIVRARATRWQRDTKKRKNALVLTQLVRDDRAFKFEGHTRGRSADLHGGFDWEGAEGPRQIGQALEDLGPGEYRIGLPFQGQFFPPEEYWVNRAEAARAAVGKDGTPEPVTEPSLEKYYSSQYTADWKPDRKNGWRIHPISGTKAVTRLKSAELKQKIAELQKRGWSIVVFPDNDAHLHVTKTG